MCMQGRFWWTPRRYFWQSSPHVTSIPADINKTISPSDLPRPEVAQQVQALNQFGRQLWWKRVPYAANGALRMRFRHIRWHKIWEYARGLAYGDF